MALKLKCQEIATQDSGLPDTNDIMNSCLHGGEGGESGQASSTCGEIRGVQAQEGGINARNL